MRKLRYVLLTFLSLSTPLCAFDFIVPTGTERTTTLTLADDGNSALIEEGGVIEPAAGTQGVLMNNANQTVLNEGRISTSGAAGAHGIFNAINTNVNARITNSGLISTVGDGNDGINNTAPSVVITNSGRISTIGDSAEGIFSAAAIANVRIINNGLISTAGNSSDGIENGSNNSIITNSGRILTFGNQGVGIAHSALDGVVTNSGRISTIRGGSPGILNTGARNVVINTGLISTTNATADGISSTADNSQIINSGTIRSPQASAINSSGTTPILSLLRGSNLQGPVDTVNPVTLNVETGLNLALTLNTGSFASFGITAPFALLGNAIGVIDPTGLAMQTDVVADISDTILDGIYRHKIAFPCSCLPCGCGVWVQGIGSYRQRGRESNTVGYDNWQGGFLVGYDSYLCEGNINLFGGVSFGEATVDQKTQKADTTSYVGGVSYERIFCDTFLGMVFAAGYVDWDNTRFVMNNLTPGGVDTAKANTGGLFLSPEATLAHRFASLWCHPSMSFTLRYAGLFLGSYTESGSLTNLSVRNREVDLLTTRFEMTIPYAASRGVCCLNFEPYVGVYGRYLVGGKNVSANLLGQSLNFDPGSPHNLAALLIGFRGLHSFRCFNLSANFEASFDNHSSIRILGEGGLGYTF